MIKLNYNLETMDVNERQHACFFCANFVYEMGIGNYCTKYRDTVQKVMIPNDCKGLEFPQHSPCICRRDANKRKRKTILNNN